MNHNETEVEKIGISKITRDLILFYTKFTTIEPIMAPDATCTPLIEFDKASCANHPTVFTGPRDKPVKVASMIQLGFDVDTLEIHLHELSLVADKIFIIESTWTHLKGVKKPLIWEMISHMPAFIQFKDKVVHLIIDDVENTVNFDQNDIWSLENYQEMIRFKRFLQWNDKVKEFGPDDIIGFGDADEIASFKNILLLKHCHFNHASVDIGILFYMGSLNRAFKTDWPVPGHGRLFLGDPTYFTIKSAIEKGKPSRMRGQSPAYLVGGAHLTNNGYLPFQILKRSSCTECGHQSIKDFANLGTSLRINDLNALESSLADSSNYKDRQLNAEAAYPIVKDYLHMLPWFLTCNPGRYPRFFDKPDPRIQLPKSKISFEC